MTKILGQTAFEAYNEDRGGVNHLGKKTPEWDALPEEIRHAWGVAARAVVEALPDASVADSERNPRTRTLKLVEILENEKGSTVRMLWSETATFKAPPQEGL